MSNDKWGVVIKDELRRNVDKASMGNSVHCDIFLNYMKKITRNISLCSRAHAFSYAMLTATCDLRSYFFHPSVYVQSRPSETF